MKPTEPKYPPVVANSPPIPGSRQNWILSTRMGGYFPLESVGTLNWNHWGVWTGASIKTISTMLTSYLLFIISAIADSVSSIYDVVTEESNVPRGKGVSP